MPHREQQKVRSVGPGWFALVMATGIVSTAANRQGFPWISLALLATAAVSYAVLVVLSLLRLWRWPMDVRADLVTAPRAFGFFAVVAGSAVLGERLLEQHVETVALALLAVAGLGWLVLGYTVPAAVVLAADKPPLAAAVDGSWLLWVVATQSVSTAAALAAHGTLHELATVTAVITWAVGLVLYLALLTLLLLRLLVAPVAPRQMTTSYWIVMGATAITVLAGSRILQLDRARPLVRLVASLVEGLSLLMWAFGTWTVPLLLIFGIWRHLLARDRLVFTPQLWTLVFPLGMYSVASAELGQVTGLRFLAGPARAAFWAALVTWVAVFAGMATSLATGSWHSGRRRSRAARQDQVRQDDQRPGRSRRGRPHPPRAPSTSSAPDARGLRGQQYHHPDQGDHRATQNGTDRIDRGSA